MTDPYHTHCCGSLAVFSLNLKRLLRGRDCGA
jgi:hypothetical protein